MSIVGARPQFVKLAPIAWASSDVFNHQILHTGQHYDPLLSDSFFDTLNIPQPDFKLGIGSGTHGHQTGKMLIEIENVLMNANPDHVVVYGDTNSTLAGALAASKLHIPISHIEAGLRSFNRRMPEELNRIITDHCSSYLFAPTENSMLNLKNEGLASRSILSGDVMVETLKFIRNRVAAPSSLSDYLFCTLHRAENTDDPIRIRFLIERLRKSQIEVHLHCHPRLRDTLQRLSLMKESENLKFFPPLDYVSTISKLVGSAGVITDSGGLQKEAYILNKHCMVVREESEWIETITPEGNFLDPNLERVVDQWWKIPVLDVRSSNIFGDGSASKMIVSQILEVM
jgi:UDP-N-acetylglucosamine 2-epimerase (non-hydrolysing)